MTAPPTPFQPFEVELSNTLGWSDGSSLNVVEHATNDGMVFHHERIHGALINATIDGNLLRLLRIAGPRLADSQLADELARASQYLLEGSRFAHECAATYLGVIYLETEQDRAAALSRLPEQYRAYYDFMSAIVDAHCKSSFLRYLIAQSIAHFWFSSRALIELARTDYRGTAIMCEEFCPDWRAHTSAPWLTRTGVGDAIAASVSIILSHESLCQSIQFSDARDVTQAWNDDSWWMRQPRSTAGFIEELISATTFDYFLEHSDLRSAAAELIRNTDLSETLVKPLYERAGVELISVNEDRRKSPHANASLASALREFVIVARTVSHIRPRLVGSSPDSNKVLGMGDLDAFVERTSVVDVIFPEAEAPDAAYFNEFVAQAREDGSPAGWMFSSYRRCRPQLASEVLRRIMRRQASGESGMQVDCIVVPGYFEDKFSGYNSLLRFLNEPSGSVRAASSHRSPVAEFARLIGREFLYVYVRDDWARIVGTTEHKRPVTHVGTIPVNIEGREPFLLNVARIAGFASTLLKAYPMHAMPVIDDYYHSCFERGLLHKLEAQPNGSALLEQSRRALVAITAVWRQI
ncbi:hypothetical protein WJ12_13900 [Burkholderia seminalis]|uniref:hypothetical protein n=1 Tax=Burkholderia seminalis TaxID=488731 RepID=UPI0008417113|nr:hypothetical protein [Burkholderia seminalis]AOJ25855.1 hypothetical protein WJ12_13900 [Burkholderia seminalis]MCA8043591.1 hypothetical protein [Burkholderia seminalis]